MKYYTFILALFFSIVMPGYTLFSQVSQNEAKKPKLIVGVVVDQMRYDYLTKFSNKYGEGGFKKLEREGHNFKNNYLNYVPTKTAPGHASIYTGTTPSVHGIINNSWYNKKLKKIEYCVNDPNVSPVGTGSKVERHSPNNLLVETIGDANTIATNGKGKTISIALKSRAAILSGGKKADAAYWFRGKGQGGWITSSYYTEQLPEWVRKFNESEKVDIYLDTWNTLLPIESYTESTRDNTSFERGFNGKEKVTFPYNLKALAPENGNYDILKYTPFGNSLTLDFALAALENEALGKDEFTDFLLISFSSTDYIGHNFGVNAIETEDAYLRLDRDIERMLLELNKKVGKENYTLFLTADHGALENSNFLKSEGIAASYFKEGSFKSDLKTKMFALYKDVNVIEDISNNQIYFNKEKIKELGLTVEELTKNILIFLNDYPMIAKALSRKQILSQEFTSTKAQYIQKGFHKERGGDIYYVLEQNTAVYAQSGSGHGSLYEYDSHIPLLFYGARIKKGETNERTYSTSIVATIAEIIDLKIPDTASNLSLKCIKL
ncbi:alkaline phosphatase PafA [Patiriisocius hiemis]|uniref:Alkaline phosphatase PafA n=1 Tax=Patiriisocius hiemis TaxID=3075604 RepID=A0ABU2YEN4_9FLAO|nr:alkaline phosphatase PafA [Constantimarinum sp. W242]MDT0556655.1 alkaline phosphatase PafA [Constantimarinum sp. W242]